MRTINFILAFAIILLGPSLAGSTEGVPGIGSFSYIGTSVGTDSHQVTVIAGLTRAVRS
jgi:hypothetical protein